MKTMKKLLALVLALTMVFALSATAFATEGSEVDKTTGKIKVTNPHKETQYDGYRILALESWSDPTQDDTATTDDDRYAYKLAGNSWDAFVTGTVGQNYFTVDDMNYVTWTPKAGFTAETFAEAAIAYATAQDIDPDAGKYCNTETEIYLETQAKDEDGNPMWQTDTNGDQVLDGEGNPIPVMTQNLPLGWYLVDTSLGALCSLNTTDETAEIQEKNVPTPPDKKMQVANGTYTGEVDDSEIGKVVNYEIKIPIGAGADNYHVYDAMTPGLELINDASNSGIKVYLQAKDTAYADKTPVAPTYSDDGVTKNAYTFPPCGTYTYSEENDMGGFLEEDEVVTTDFELLFDNEYIKSLTVGDTLYIQYSATVTDDARIGVDPDNENKFILGYGDKNFYDPMKTHTETYGINLFKFEKVTAGDKARPGADFVLYKVEGGKKQYLHVTNEIPDEYKNDATLEGNWVEGTYHPTKVFVEDSTTMDNWTTGYPYTPKGATEEKKTPDFYDAQDNKSDLVMTSDANGFVKIAGLEAGTYYLEEVRAPKGYNMLNGPITVTITKETTPSDSVKISYSYKNPQGETETGEGEDIDLLNGIVVTEGEHDASIDNAIAIQNSYGPEMPITGGMGTTLFYVIGSFLMIGAAVMLVAKKRTSI